MSFLFWNVNDYLLSLAVIDSQNFWIVWWEGASVSGVSLEAVVICRLLWLCNIECHIHMNCWLLLGRGWGSSFLAMWVFPRGLSSTWHMVLEFAQNEWFKRPAWNMCHHSWTILEGHSLSYPNFFAVTLQSGCVLTNWDTLRSLQQVTCFQHGHFPFVAHAYRVSLVRQSLILPQFG